MLSEVEKGSDDEDTTQAGFSTPRSSHASVVFNLQASRSLRKDQEVKRAAEESLVFNQVRSPSRKIIRAHPSENEASIQILQKVCSLARIVKSQSSYI